VSGPSGEPSGALPGPPEVGRQEARPQARLAGRVREPPPGAGQFLARADAHRARVGGRPNVTCGAAGEARRGLDEALRQGPRGRMARQVRRARRSKMAQVATGGPGREHLAGRAPATRCSP
jgi:hypothetical protein